MNFTSFLFQGGIAIYSKLPFKKQLCEVIRGLPFSKEKIYRDLKFKGKFSVKLRGKKFQLIHSGQTVENEIFWKGIDGGWEKVSLSIWTQLCESANVILDIGANTGIYSLIAAHVNPTAQVFAFEPSSKVFDKLNQNVLLNRFKNLSTVPAAVSDRNGTAVLYDFDDEHQYSASLNQNMPVEGTNKIAVNVPVITLDSFIVDHQLQEINLLKIDVEMHEPEVLDGFRDHLQIFKPTMIIEILSDEMGARIEQQLQGLDYLFFDMDEVHQPAKTAHLKKSGCYNFLICTEAVAKQLKLI